MPTGRSAANAANRWTWAPGPAKISACLPKRRRQMPSTATPNCST